MKQLDNEKRIAELKADDPFSDPDHANDNAAVDTGVREQLGHQSVEAQITSLQKQIGYIKNALKKIMRNSYGFCERCNESIPIKRLEIVPEARYCIMCEKKLVK